MKTYLNTNYKIDFKEVDEFKFFKLILNTTQIRAEINIIIDYYNTYKLKEFLNNFIENKFNQEYHMIYTDIDNTYKYIFGIKNNMLYYKYNIYNSTKNLVNNITYFNLNDNIIKTGFKQFFEILLEKN